MRSLMSWKTDEFELSLLVDHLANVVFVGYPEGGHFVVRQTLPLTEILESGAVWDHGRLWLRKPPQGAVSATDPTWKGARDLRDVLLPVERALRRSS